MATRRRGNPNPQGTKPDKIITDAIRLELHAEVKDCDGKPTKKLRLLARRLIDEALGGNVHAMCAVMDRIEGKVPQGLTSDDNTALVVRVVKFADVDDAPVTQPAEASEASVH
jgi:hypothetical protein